MIDKASPYTESNTNCWEGYVIVKFYESVFMKREKKTYLAEEDWDAEDDDGGKFGGLVWFPLVGKRGESWFNPIPHRVLIQVVAEEDQVEHEHEHLHFYHWRQIESR